MPVVRFSALQRAENSSIHEDAAARDDWTQVSVLFSEPKIPQSLTEGVRTQRASSFSALQRAENSSMLGALTEDHAQASVSVLFSEPKIPQSLAGFWVRNVQSPFQCSSASRKFLKSKSTTASDAGCAFQCSSASRKFLKPDPRTCVHPYSRLRRSRFVVPEPSWCVAMTPVY